jgi:hypothetical protein
MNIPNCPSCGNHDSARRVSAIVKEQSSSGEATTTGTASKPLNFSYKIDAKTNSTQQSDLAGKLVAKQSASRAGTTRMGCGSVAIFFGFIGTLVTASGSSEMSPIFVGLLVIGLVAFVFGIAASGRDSEYAARKSEADEQNKRIDKGWYCAKCDVRFDEAGSF